MVPGIPHYSTVSRRINRLEIKINEKLGNDIVIALDSTGIKVDLYPYQLGSFRPVLRYTLKGTEYAR